MASLAGPDVWCVPSQPLAHGFVSMESAARSVAGGSTTPTTQGSRPSSRGAGATPESRSRRTGSGKSPTTRDEVPHIRAGLGCSHRSPRQPRSDPAVIHGQQDHGSALARTRPIACSGLTDVGRRPHRGSARRRRRGAIVNETRQAGSSPDDGTRRPRRAPRALCGTPMFQIRRATWRSALEPRPRRPRSPVAASACATREDATS